MNILVVHFHEELTDGDDSSSCSSHKPNKRECSDWIAAASMASAAAKELLASSGIAKKTATTTSTAMASIAAPDKDDSQSALPLTLPTAVGKRHSNLCGSSWNDGTTKEVLSHGQESSSSASCRDDALESACVDDSVSPSFSENGYEDWE